jgi:hypothetical protein
MNGLFTLFTFSDSSKVIIQSEECKPATTALAASLSEEEAPGAIE